MATRENKDNNTQQAAETSNVGLKGLIGQYQKIKKNAETYPYVWGSYIVVYGTLGLWFTYRWRKLRLTENRVRGLQERLRKINEAEQASSSTVNSVYTSPKNLP